MTLTTIKIFILVLLSLTKLIQSLNHHVQTILNLTRVTKGPYFNSENEFSYGQLQLSSNQSIFVDFADKYAMQSSSINTDGEDVDAIERYFWNLTNGIIIELGSLDGLTLSMSRSLLQLGWHRILIEGALKWKEGLELYSNDSVSYAVAICKHTKKIHYSSADAVGGILEFMSETFRNSFHKETTWTPIEKWHTLRGVSVTYCLPMHAILSDININHVNLWILDVEGAEFDILQTVHWHKVKFDILCIETDKNNRPIGFQSNITTYLEERDYEFIWENNRNSWYKHKLFTPSSRDQSLRYTREDLKKNYRDGTLIKLSGYRNKQVYVMSNHKKYPVSNLTFFEELLSKNNGKLIELDFESFNMIESG